MVRSRYFLILNPLILSLLVVLGLATVAPALAHGGIEIGPYELVLGWVVEPPLLGEPNAVFLSVENTETGQPVEGITSLDISVTIGNQTRELRLSRLDGGAPGEYAASFIPTERGVYTVKLSGKIEEQVVNVTADIDDVESAEAHQFPAVLPSLPQINQQLTTLQAENQSLRASAALNRWLAVGGIIVGLGGLVVSIVSLRKK